MAEYIEREKAIERIRPHVKPQTIYGEGYIQAIEHAIDILELLPAADVQLAKRGRWLIKENHFHSCGIMLYAECSCCGHTCSTPESEHNNYCPNCGADMRGEDNG